MESEARLTMFDGGLPKPELQYELVDLSGRRWRLDFAWPSARLAVEYDGFDWHSDPESLRCDRQKRAALRELGWHVMSIVFDDVRRRPYETVRQIAAEIERERAHSPIARRRVARRHARSRKGGPKEEEGG